MTMVAWEHRKLEPFELASSLTPAEHRFKLAVCDLVLRGLYPSARQVYSLLGKDTRGRVNLNGRECQWKHEMFALFGILPSAAYTRRLFRGDWEDFLSKQDYEIKCRRGKGGVLEAIK